MDRVRASPYRDIVMIRTPTIALIAALAVTAPRSSTAGAQEATISLSVTRAFSPNGDGRKDEATITVGVSGPGPVTVRVLDGAAELRGWEEEAPAEGVVLSWKGKDQEGNVLEDGTYTVEATADGAAGPETVSLPVRIDTRAPSVSWESIRPSRASGRKAIRFHVRISDAASEIRVKVTVADTLGVVAAHQDELATGSRVISWRPRYRGRSLYPGTYRAAFMAEDDAGNRRASRGRSFRVERKVKARVFRRLGRTGRKVAITIDDCHYPGAWRSMLRTLRRARVKAAFFCPGDRMAMFPGLVRKTVRQGHTLGSHGWDHGAMAGLGKSGAERKLRRDRATAWRIARVTTAPYFRPPYGSYDGAVVHAAGATGHGRVVMWDVTTGDTSGAGVGDIARNAVRGARPGSIILMHTKDVTAQALPSLIRGLRAKGLRPVSLPKLFRAAGYP